MSVPVSSKKEYIEKDNDLEEIHQVGTLVMVKSASYGVLEKCFLPENFNKTISMLDNIHIPTGTVGMVVGGVGAYHTVMYTVLWGGTLGGKKLIVSGNKIAKISDNLLDI